MSDEAPVEIFECLSCGELWKSSYAPGHECPECETNNVVPFDSKQFTIDAANDLFEELESSNEIERLKLELAEARKDKDNAIKCLVSAIRKLLKPEELKYFEQVLRRGMFNYEMYGIEVPEIEKPFTGAIEVDRKT